MGTRHTPGPWRIDAYGDESEIIGRPVWPCERHRVKGEWMIASVDDLGGDYPEEAEANARLIAAAPELLEIAIQCAELAERWGDQGPLVQAARAAIAKATQP